MKHRLRTLSSKDQRALQKFVEEKRELTNITLRAMPETWDEESRTLKMVATTNFPYEVGFWWPYEEMLEISEEAIDLDRVKSGKAPLLKNHKNDIDCVLGRIIDYAIEKPENPIPEMAPAEQFKESSDKLVVTVHFDDDEYNNEKLLPKIRSGSVGNVSIGYRIMKYDLFEGPDKDTLDRLIARRWELFEVSLVAVPADANAGVRGVDKGSNPPDHRNNTNSKGEIMDEEEKKKAEAEKQAALEAARKRAAEETEAALKAEREKAALEKKEELEKERLRVATISTIAQETGLKNLEELIKDGSSVEKVRKLGYEAMKARLTNVNPMIEAGEDGDETKARHFQNAFLLRMKKAKKVDEIKGNEFIGMPIVEAMKRYRNTPWLNNAKFLRAELKKSPDLESRELGQGSFPNLIEDAINRNLNESYAPRMNPFADITETETQQNLHPHKVRRFDLDLEPEPVGEGEDFPMATPSGEGNNIDIVKFAKAFAITEEAMLNDDLNGFDRVFLYMGHGMTQRETRLIANLIFPKAAEFDGAALFSEERLNLVTDTTGGITIANVKALRTQMRKQLTPAGKPTDIFPACILCGEDLAEDAKAFLRATVWPRQFGENVDTFREGITKIITHPYVDMALGSASVSDFIIAASPMQGIPIVKRVIHSDVMVPEIASEWNLQRSSMIYYSRFYLGVGLGDYRGMTRFSKS